MVKILFLCHGNICRSPMAEFILKHLVAQAGRSEEFEISSAAVSREELGHPIYPPAVRELQKHNIPFTPRRARLVTDADFSRYHRIYYMDARNARYLRSLGAPMEKCRPLLSRDVADPYYSGDFTQTWEDIYTGCEQILEEFSC